MHGEEAKFSRELLVSYLEEQLLGLDDEARRQRLDEIRSDLEESIASDSISAPDDILIVRQFLADLDADSRSKPVSNEAPHPKNGTRAVRRGAMMLIPRASLLIFSLLGATRSGNARNAVVGVIAVALVLIARSAYVSLKATSA